MSSFNNISIKSDKVCVREINIYIVIEINYVESLAEILRALSKTSAVI